MSLYSSRSSTRGSTISWIGLETVQAALVTTHVAADALSGKHTSRSLNTTTLSLLKSSSITVRHAVGLNKWQGHGWLIIECCTACSRGCSTTDSVSLAAGRLKLSVRHASYNYKPMCHMQNCGSTHRPAMSLLAAARALLQLTSCCVAATANGRIMITV